MLLSNSAQIRNADRIQIDEHHFPGILLMEEAGKLATGRIVSLYPNQNDFLILVGPGNNGGDGLVIARYLYLQKKNVKIVYSHSPERYKGDAKINYDIITQLPVNQSIYQGDSLYKLLKDIPNSPILIDALLGTGIQSALRGTVADLINLFKETELPVVAIDLPSGLNANTGEQINEVIPADYTLTFQLPKICQFVTPASLACGKTEIIDIGIWPSVIEKLGIKRRLLDDSFVEKHSISRKKDDHKGSFGHVLIVGGSKDMAGAITLAALAAVRSGVGLCTVFTPEACRQTVFTHCPEAMCMGIEGNLTDSLERFKEALVGKSAVVFGPGMGINTDTIEFLKKALPFVKVPILLDADALNILAQTPNLWGNLNSQCVLTPHPGEMRRLVPGVDVINQKLESAEKLASEKQVNLVLKGAGTIVALADGHSFVNTTGNPGMATGGSGDVLSGVIGSLMAQGIEPGIAAGLGVYIHGLAGDEAIKKAGMAGLTAMRLTESIKLY